MVLRALLLARTSHRLNCGKSTQPADRAAASACGSPPCPALAACGVHAQSCCDRQDLMSGKYIAFAAQGGSF